MSKQIAILDNNNIVANIISCDDKNAEKEASFRNGIILPNGDIQHVIGKGWKYHNGNWIPREKTKAEIEAEQAAAEKQAKLESAKTKLTALGLDEAEVQAILGL